MGFKDVVGHERIKHILQRALEKERLPNSLLFCGPEGVGKRRMAFALARALCCQRLKDDACDACGPCRSIKEGERKGENRYPDVMLVFPDPKSDTIRTETIKEIREIAYIKPLMGRKRVIIIDGVQQDIMADEALNALLKVLEEPPAFTHFILIADNPDLVLSTIKSRCRILSFSRVSDFDIEQELRAKGQDQDRAKLLAVLSRGNLEQALAFDWEDLSARRLAAWDMFRALLRKENARIFLDSYGFLKRKAAKEELPQVLEMFSAFGRDLIVLKEGGDSRLLLNPDFEDRLRRESAGLTLDQAVRFLALVDEVLAGLDKRLNIGLLVSAFYSSIMNRL